MTLTCELQTTIPNNLNPIMTVPTTDRAGPQPNYFTCTLGQAAEINAKHPTGFKTINDIIDHYAASTPDALAVAFPVPQTLDDKPWGRLTICKSMFALGYIRVADVKAFRQLRDATLGMAQLLLRIALPQPTAQQESKTVAILAASSYEFLVLWLGLTRLGYASLQIA